jgi:hypothetical protein
MAQRGRPKKQPMEPVTEAQNAMANVLAVWCGVPGCLPRNHIDEVKELETALEEAGFYIVKKRVD